MEWSTGPRFRRCAATTGSPTAQSATACGCGRNTTSSRGPTTSFRSAFTAFSGCGPRRRAKAIDYEFRAVTRGGSEARTHRRGLCRRASRRLAGQGLGAGHADRAGRTNTDQGLISSERAAGRTGTTCSTRGSCLLAGLSIRTRDAATLKFGLTQAAELQLAAESMEQRQGGGGGKRQEHVSTTKH